MNVSSDESKDRKANDGFENAIFPYIPFKFSYDVGED